MNHFPILLFLFFDLIYYSNCDIYDDGKFFDPRNFLDSECIVGNDYIYLGKKSTTKNEKNCEIWENVKNYHLKLFEGYNQFFFADEYLDHNYCRNIPLDAYHHDIRFNNATAHHYVHEDGWQNGPWCYVKVSEGEEILLWGTFKTEYIPMPCFEQCSGEPQKVSEGPPPPPKKNIATTKYNKKLIEHLTKNLFSDFDHGDKKYYESKPSDKNVSAEFESNAKIIFYVGMSLLILAVTTIFAKHFYSKWKKRPKAVKKEVKEAEQEEPVENNDQNENFNEPEIVQMPKVSNENPIDKEMKGAEIAKISMSEEKPTPSPQKRKLRKR